MKKLAWWQKTLNFRLGKYLQSNFERYLGDQFFWQEEQERTWRYLKKSLRSAAIYQNWNLEKINNYGDYLQKLPPTSYEDYQDFIDLILKGKTNILFPGNNQYFGLTSGTSGKDCKKIPYNGEMIAIFKNAQKLMSGQMIFDGNLQVFTANRFVYGSNPVCHRDGKFTYGYISGIISANTPRIIGKNNFPRPEVLVLENWDQKLEKIYQTCSTLDIEILAGIPNYLITIMEYLLERSGKKFISELWPQVHSMVYGATPILQYQERINRLVGKNLNYYGLYASTEAPLGLPVNNAAFNLQEYTFVPGVLYSFVDCYNPATILGVMDLRVGGEYLLQIGTPNGFLQYQMKDIIKIVRLSPYIAFEVMGRDGSLLNLAAEKTSESHLLNAVEKTAKELKIAIDHHIAYPIEREDEPCYGWVLFTGNNAHGSAIDKEQLRQKLDANLMHFNGDYKDCRDDRIIFPPQVQILPSHHLNDLFAKNKHRGQFKMKTSFANQKSFQEYFQANFPFVLDSCFVHNQHSTLASSGIVSSPLE